MITRALQLRAQIEYFCFINQQKKPKDGSIISTQELSEDDGSILKELAVDLQHFNQATIRLEGLAEQGHHGAVWECILLIEELVEELAELQAQQPTTKRLSRHPAAPV